MLHCLAEEGTPALPIHACDPAGLEAARARLSPAQGKWLDAAGFAAKAHEILLLPDADGLAGAVLGLGAESITPWSFGQLPARLPAGTTWRFAEAGDWAADATLGFCLGAYGFFRYRAATRPTPRLVPPSGSERAVIAAEAAWHVRDLINTPANDLGPAELASYACGLAEAHGAASSVIEGQALREGFPALYAVGAGSPRAPRVVVLEWGERDAPLVALCGKGVCFDTGGLDLKPSGAMLRMKKDMGGAATVLGMAEMVMRLRLPVRLLVLVGAVENAVSGDAFRPLDVLRTRAGISVEVGNTDAEGRLVLCDLLTFAAERQPSLLVDCATLTGAARVAVGPDLPALFTPSESVAENLLACGQMENDPMWRLPLHAGYDSWLDSTVADTNTVATRPMAGAIVAALFLRKFVPATIPWAHLDLYAWNDSTRPGRPEGGEAQCMRAAVRAIERHAQATARAKG